MEQIQKTSNSASKLIQNLTAAIQSDGGVDIAVVDKMQINTELKKFKYPDGSLNYQVIFEIPQTDRIPAMAERNLSGTIKIITVALTLAFETMNISRKMNAFQILDLAETIVDTSSEGDIISFEDLMLFLQKLTRGEYPELYEGLDQVKFMKRFSLYRDERWDAARLIAKNKHLEFKSLGPADRMTVRDELGEHFSTLVGRVSDLKQSLRESIQENNRLKNGE